MQKLQTRLSLSFALLAILAAAIVTFTLYNAMQDGLHEAIRQQLHDVASLAALQVDVDAHSTLTSPADEGNPAYMQIKHDLQHIRDAGTDIFYIYTMRQDADGNITIIVDAESNPDEIAHLGEIYDDASPLLVDNFATLSYTIVEEDFYTDKWGTWLTAYAPVYNPAGQRECVLGVDKAANIVIATERRFLWIALSIFAAIIPLVSILGWLLGRMVAIPITALTNGARQITKGDLKHRVSVKSSGEIGELTSSFNYMTQQLEQSIESLQTEVSRRILAEEELLKQQSHLEELVEKRTNALAESNSQLSRELSERKQMEQEIRRSEEKYRAVVEHTGSATIIVEEDTTISMVNAEFELLSGYSREEIENKKSWTEFVMEDDVERMTEQHQLRRDNEGLALSHYEFRFRNRKGDIRHIFVTNGMIPDTNQSVASLVDITEQKKAEEQMKEMEQKAQSASRLATVGTMASGIAHEINNPLTGVVGFSNLLLDRKDLPVEIRKELEIIHEGGERVSSIVKRLLTFARQSKPERSYVNINKIINSTLALRSYELKTSDIKVLQHLDPELPMTMADGGQLQDVFMNIIINAEKEMGKAHGGGQLSIRTETSGTDIKVSIADNGPGIKKKNLNNIFNPFFTTREVGEGTGLGLSLSYGIIKEHNGRLYAESEPGKGATFFIELPIIAKGKAEETAEPVEVKKTTTANAKIIVVDDEPSILAFLKEFLGREGHEVITANRCELALEKIKAEHYDLILCDIKMSGMGGIRFFQQVNKEMPLLAKRFMFITGFIIDASTSRLLSEKGIPHTTKPFDLKDLKSKINQLLEKSGS